MSVRPDMNDEFKSGLQSLCNDFVLWSYFGVFGFDLQEDLQEKKGNVLCKTEFKIGVVTEILWSYLKVLTGLKSVCYKPEDHQVRNA